MRSSTRGPTLRCTGRLRRPLIFDVERPLPGVKFCKSKDSNRWRIQPVGSGRLQQAGSCRSPRAA